MKKFLSILVLATGLLSSCDFLVDAGAYNDKMVSLYDDVIDTYNAYMNEVDASELEIESMKALEALRQETANVLSQKRQEMVALGDLGDDTGLKDAFLAYADYMIEIINNEEKELIEVWMRMAETEGEITQADLNREDELIEAIDAQGDDRFEALTKAQQAFATKYNYELE